MYIRQIFLDTETSGLGPSAHRIIEIAAVETINGQLSGKYFHTYLDPERSIDPRAQQVHGISLNSLRGKPKFHEIAEQFLAFINGSECLIHNASFDCSFIDAELSRAGYDLRLRDIATITCTLKLAKHYFPGEQVALDNLIHRAGLGFTRNKHSAVEDANLLAKVYTTLFENRNNQARVQDRASISESVTPQARWPHPNLGTQQQRVIKSNSSAPLSTPQVTQQLVQPSALGMEKTIELVCARQETFYYRQQYKRIIDYHVVNQRRWKEVRGPLVYAVTDHQGLIRYIGKWNSNTALYARWLRHQKIHHQERARNLYIKELEAGHGPITVWSVSISEIKHRIPHHPNIADDAKLANALEALWIQRWKDQLLWNNRPEPIMPGFHDGDFWNAS
ncbi:MAG: exonuclease domain-containing protein [Pelistega sp.]|nr:exonuclease domain-containing protein [Pelistega sp.]